MTFHNVRATTSRIAAETTVRSTPTFWIVPALLTVMSATGLAQVKPQITPMITKVKGVNCTVYDAETPSSLIHGSLNPLEPPSPIKTDDLIQCIRDLQAAVADTVRRGIPAPSPQPESGTPANQRPGASPAPPDQVPAPPSAAGSRDSSGSSTATAKIGATTEEVVHTELLKEYLAYRRIGRWNQAFQKGQTVPGCSPGTKCATQFLDNSTRAQLNATFGELSETLENALSDHGLSQPFSAELVTAFSLTQPASQTAVTPAGGGSNAGQQPPSSAGTQQNSSPSTGTGAAGLVRWQSVHFYAAPDRRFDLDISGQFGFEPVLALVQPAVPSPNGSSPAVDASIQSSYQQAFEWHVSAEPNLRIADLAELSPYLRIGQSILSATATLVDNGPNSTVLVAAQNNTNRAEMFVEAGGSVNIYGRSLEILHLTKGLLSPMFSFGGGLRRDNRFAKSGVLSSYTSPEQRVFLRFMIDALQLANPNQADKPFTIGASVEFETALSRPSTGYVPAGTRILIRGDLNLFKATQGSK